MKRFKIKNAVSFHSSIEKAKENKELQKYITDTYNYKPIDTYTVSGKMPTTKRNDIVQEFAKSPKALITNARCLTEGVDVPNIDCIVFADPRRSKVDIVQALGRALRKKEGKDWGYVILPVVYDGNTNEIDNDNFNEILSIVRGLAANDERIIEYFKDKSLGDGSKGKSGVVELFDMISETLSESDFAEQLSIKLWEKLSRFSWMPFEEAKAFVHTLGLKTGKEWQKYCMSGNKPLDIPFSPYNAYKNAGYTHMGDWLGTGRVPEIFRTYRDFREARNYARSHKLESNNAWTELTKSPDFPNDIPKSPRWAYRNSGWVSMADWLGNNNIAPQKRKFLPFLEAREYAHSLKLKSSTEWHKFCKSGNKPIDIPSVPSQQYKGKGWAGFQDWLGNDSKRSSKKYCSIGVAMDYVRKLNLDSYSAWVDYTKSNEIPLEVPKNLYFYKKDPKWKGIGDFMGTGNISSHKREYKDFNEARKFVHSLRLKSTGDWNKYKKSKEKPKTIPYNPARTYKDKGWISMGDWLGHGKIYWKNIQYKSFEDAREFARQLNLKSNKEWKQFCKTDDRPLDIPTNVYQKYKGKGWRGWIDFLGNE